MARSSPRPSRLEVLAAVGTAVCLLRRGGRSGGCWVLRFLVRTAAVKPKH